MNAERGEDRTVEGAIFAGFERETELLPGGCKARFAFQVADISAAWRLTDYGCAQYISAAEALGSEAKRISAFELNKGAISIGVNVGSHAGVLGRPGSFEPQSLFPRRIVRE